MSGIPTPTDFSGDRHPEVFAQVPAGVTYGRPGQLSEEQVKQFYDEGFLIVRDYFDPSLLEPVKVSIEEEVDSLAKVMHKAGKIKDLYSDYGLFQRFTKMETDWPGTNRLFNKLGHLPEAVKTLWTNERLLNLVEQLLGSGDVQGHPIWNFRPKTPNSDYGAVPWHQDVGYTDRDSHDVMQLTAWIPFLDTNKDNGCMQVIRGGHKTGRVLPHYSCWGDTHFVEIKEKEMEQILNVDVSRDTETCEVPYGGMLLFNNILPHRSLPNVSDAIRWSVDLRWQRADKPVGFHGLKQGVRFRSSTDRADVIDWSPLTTRDNSLDSVNALTKDGTDFSSIITGPWILKWPIVHTNRHVQATLDAYTANKSDVSNYHNA